MTAPNYPSVNRTARRADLMVHLAGLGMILGAGGILISKAAAIHAGAIAVAVALYVLCALVSNLASCLYHFSPWHGHRKMLRRMDHAAIYPSISGTFTPFFVLADTSWTLTLLWVCWGLTVVAIWQKITNENVKSRWSTASYLGLGAIGMSALPDLTNVPIETLWCIVGGAVCYVIGTGFYVRRTLPFRYAIWHAWVNLGGIAMYVGIWLALF